MPSHPITDPPRQRTTKFVGKELEPRRLLTVRELAPRLRVGVPRLYEMAREGLIPSIRLGRQLRFELTQIERWIDAGGVGFTGRQGRASDA